MSEVAPRPLEEVMDAMLSVIPPHYEHLESLVLRFNEIKDSIAYCPPEGTCLLWEQAAGALETYVGDPSKSTWKMTILEIFNGIQDYTKYL